MAEILRIFGSVSYLQDIPRFSGPNMGGVLELKVARIADVDVDNFPVPSNGIIYGDIPFLPQKGFKTWYAAPSTPRFASAGQSSQEGPLKDNAIECFLAKDTPTLKYMLDQMEDDSFIVLYKDGNGQQRILGTPEAPVFFNFSQESGDAPGSRNGYSCRFYSNGPGNSYSYNGSISVPPAGSPPVIITRGDGQVLYVAQSGDIVVLQSAFDLGFEILGYGIGIQGLWDGASSSAKDAFVDANRSAILQYLEVLLMNQLTDGASINADCDNEDQIMFYLSTAQSAPTLNVQNFGKVASVTVKKTIAGDTTITLSGSGLKFVDLDADNETVSATIDIVLSGANPSYYEINLIDSGFTDAGDKIIHVTSKL